MAMEKEKKKFFRLKKKDDSKLPLGPDIEETVGQEEV